jgi:hypothetical protein
MVSMTMTFRNPYAERETRDFNTQDAGSAVCQNLYPGVIGGDPEGRSPPPGPAGTESEEQIDLSTVPDAPRL